MSKRLEMTIVDVNRMPYDEFIRTFTEVVDDSGSFLAAAVWKYRPFLSLEDLQKAFGDVLSNLPLAGKEAILRLMPDVTGKSALKRPLGRESLQERAMARLNTLTDAEKEDIAYLNDRYKRKFAFHFVACARENKKSAFLEALSKRYENPAEIEAVVGIQEVKKICYLRLKDIVFDKALPRL